VEVEEGEDTREGLAQLDVSKVREVDALAASEAQRIMSGVTTWPASTSEKEAAGAAAAINVMMSQPLATLAFMETGAEAEPVQEAQREPLM
jgi:hypothetical protein